MNSRRSGSSRSIANLAAGIVICCLIGLGHGRLLSQHPLYYPVNEEHGLPTDEIYEVVQDRFGLLWVASNSGLFSYDGVRVHRYSHPVEKTKAAIAVMHDTQDRIWSLNAAGQVFKVTDDSLELMLDPVATQPIRGFAFDPDGGFCTVVGNMLLGYDAGGKQRGSLQLDAAIGPSALIADVAIRNGKVYLFVSKSGAYEADLALGKQRLIIETTDLITGGFNFKGEALYWMQINQSDQSKQVLQLIGDAFVPIYATTADDSKERWLRIVPAGPDRLWICTVDGAFAIQRQGSIWKKAHRCFEDVPVSSVLEDKEGITWFSTLSEGFLVMPSDEIIRLLPDHLQERENNMLTLCALTDGSIVAGTFSGRLFRTSPESFEVQEIYPADRDVRKYPVKQILPYKDGVLVSKGMFSYANFTAKAMQKTALLYHARDMAWVQDTLYAVLPDKVCKLNISKELASNYANSVRVHDQGGKAVESDLDGNLYFACNDGLYWLNHGALKEVLWEGNKLNITLLEAGKHGVWAAVTGKGLMLLEKGRVTRVMGLQEGLPDLHLRALYAFDDQLFFSTESDFCQLDLSDGSLTKLSASAGFNPHHINDIAVSNGRIWLATTKGIVSLPLAFSETQSIRPAIRIHRVFLDDQPIGHRGSSDPDSDGSGILEIADQNSDLRIEFEGISFRSRNQYAFEYRIAEIDTHWTRTRSEANFANYASLQPGDLTFEVRTVDENGALSEVPATLNMHVATPFHQQIWFFLLMGILILFVSFAFFQLRLRLLRRRHAIQAQLISSQLVALKAQMNPHFIFNALNSIQDFVISKDVRNSNLYLAKFSTLMRMVLDASDQNQVRLGDEIQMLRLYLDLEQLRFGTEMTYRIECAVDVEAIFIPSMIIQPFVENAVKHGLLHKKGPKRLEVHFALGTGLVCTITDNGIGRQKSEEIKARAVGASVSFSTKATVKRLDLIQQLHGTEVALEIVDLEEDGVALGTRVQIRLPVRED